MDSFNTQPPYLGKRQPDYPPLLQLLRVTAATVSGPVGGPAVLYVASTQQSRTDTLAPRDREPCLVFDPNNIGLVAGYYLGRLCNLYGGLPVYEVTGVSVSGTAVGAQGPSGVAGPSGVPGPSGAPGSSGGIPIFSGARAYRTTDQTITLTTETAVLLTSEDYDTDGYHSILSNTGRFVAPASDYYLMGASCYWGPPSAGFGSTSLFTSLRLNGSTVLDRVWDNFSNFPGYYFRQVVGSVGPVFLATGEYVETVVFCNTSPGATVKILGTGTLSTLLNVNLTNSFGHQSGMWISRLGS